MRLRALSLIAASAALATLALAQDDPEAPADSGLGSAEAVGPQDDPGARATSDVAPTGDVFQEAPVDHAAPVAAPEGEERITPAAQAAPPPETDAAAIPGAPAASELDALSQGAEDPFPDIEAAPARKPVSVTLRALDKITARYKDVETKIGEPVKFGSLEILPRTCDKRPPEDFPETTAFLEVFDRELSRARAASSVVARDIDERPKKEPKKPAPARPAPTPGAGVGTATSAMPASLDPDRIFSGWMFASTPALNALEHPVYDVWVIDCKTVAAGS